MGIMGSLNVWVHQCIGITDYRPLGRGCRVIVRAPGLPGDLTIFIFISCSNIN